MMNLESLKQLLSDLCFPEKAKQNVISYYNKINECCSKDLEEIISKYEQNYDMPWSEFEVIFAKMKEIAKKTGLHEFSVGLVYYLLLSEPLKQVYIKKGVSLDIWKTSVMDLKYKLDEAEIMNGVCGVIKFSWPVQFFRFEKFGIGKLQFEVIPFRHEFNLNGIELKPNSKVINVHIPKTGEPLDRESMLDAYKRAKEFFANVKYGDKTVFVCESWMLSEKNKQIFKPESNLFKFINDYTIVESGDYSDYQETWRIFDTTDLSDLEKLPQKTSVQRAYLDIMRKGEKTGWAYGAFVF
ncbi:MAG: hypothetical protein E7347_03655 [Clostridiales bacterium]|nr:hypothetical protein [Clostridiales bacterium]